jgi:hypothetical protein
MSLKVDPWKAGFRDEYRMNLGGAQNQFTYGASSRKTRDGMGVVWRCRDSAGEA